MSTPVLLWDGHKVDASTYLKLKVLEQRTGARPIVVQGSYNGGGVAASGGTHDGGGVADLSIRSLPLGMSPREYVRRARSSGLVAWYRTEADGFTPHIHAIDLGSKTLSPAAARQVDSWRRGRNGLANNGPDSGPKVVIPERVPMSNVKQARELIQYALDGPAARVPRRRRAARTMFAAIRAALKTGPKA